MKVSRSSIKEGLRKQMMSIKVAQRRRYIRHQGLSLVELLIALSISAVLLTATMVATDACFRSYASAAESASAQSGTRMVTHRLLAMIRTSTAHGPMKADAGVDPPVVQNGNLLSSNHIELIDSQDRDIYVEYRSDVEQLWVIIDDKDEHPLLGGVTSCVFTLKPRVDRDGTLVLERATMMLTVVPDADATLAIERAGGGHAINVIASTMPRRLD